MPQIALFIQTGRTIGRDNKLKLGLTLAKYSNNKKWTRCNDRSRVPNDQDMASARFDILIRNILISISIE